MRYKTYPKMRKLIMHLFNTKKNNSYVKITNILHKRGINISTSSIRNVIIEEQNKTNVLKDVMDILEKDDKLLINKAIAIKKYFINLNKKI